MVYRNDRNIPRKRQCFGEIDADPKGRFKSRTGSYRDTVNIRIFIFGTAFKNSFKRSPSLLKSFLIVAVSFFQLHHFSLLAFWLGREPP